MCPNLQQQLKLMDIEQIPAKRHSIKNTLQAFQNPRAWNLNKLWLRGRESLWRREALIEGNSELMINTQMMTILKVWQALPQEGFLCFYVLHLKYLHFFSLKNLTSRKVKQILKKGSIWQQKNIFVTSENNQANIVKYPSTGQ